ncbi:MAG: site-specific integrase [Acidobacteriia bacterium]|nr:site-specific integrase [Terriglobia bacterium]
MKGQGRVFKRGNVLWISYYLRGTEHRESARTTDSKLAERFLRHRLKEVGADAIGAKPFVTPQMQRATVGELLDALARDLGLRGKFNAKVESLLKPLRAHFGEQRASQVTANQVAVYIEHLLAKGYTRASVNRRTQLLGQAYRLAIRQKRLTELPLIPHLSEAGNARQGFTQRQVLNRVLANLPGYLRDVVLFCFLSSWRRGEVLSLTWENVTPDAIRLRAEHSKEREARSLALEGELLSVITRRQAVANGPLVFHRDGKPIGEFRKSWSTACRLAGVPGLLVHDLRRSGVRDLIRAGVAPHVAMSISGHKTDSMLKRYAIISEADQREALQRVEAFREAEKETLQPVTTVVQ